MAWLQYANGERFFLTGSTVSIGRDGAQDVPLVADRKVSRSRTLSWKIETVSGPWSILAVSTVQK